ncbi:hypothetical protein AAW51_2615 [Caldimonas brevitalea]|uniref:Uncharacterized protein n=1 Tax=Caldimonas brevitalea TaxID=413882 RepID=A0A0G3BPN8_9BURK|nr:hypothetical protein AAW51_2615 [Caldimonas brevitalea]
MQRQDVVPAVQGGMLYRHARGVVCHAFRADCLRDAAGPAFGPRA